MNGAFFSEYSLEIPWPPRGVGQAIWNSLHTLALTPTASYFCAGLKSGLECRRSLWMPQPERRGLCDQSGGQCPSVGIWTGLSGFLKFLSATCKPVRKTRPYCEFFMLNGFGGKSDCEVRQGSLQQSGIVTRTQRRRIAQTPCPGQPIRLWRAHEPFHNYPSWMPLRCLNRLFKMVRTPPMQPAAGPELYIHTSWER